MRQALHVLHDIWCALTGKCRPRVKHDDYLEWMSDVKHAANTGAEESRQRHALVDIYRHQRQGSRDAE